MQSYNKGPLNFSLYWYKYHMCDFTIINFFTLKLLILHHRYRRANKFPCNSTSVELYQYINQK